MRHTQNSCAFHFLVAFGLFLLAVTNIFHVFTELKVSLSGLFMRRHWGYAYVPSARHQGVEGQSHDVLKSQVG